MLLLKGIYCDATDDIIDGVCVCDQVPGLCCC